MRTILFLCKKYDSLLVFLLGGIGIALLQYSPSFADPDSFYHARIAAEMLIRPVLSFSALPFTVLADIFIDHHLLYHIILIPFVTLFDPLVGLKIATILFAAGFLAFFYSLLRTVGHASRLGAIALLLILVLNVAFFFRLNLAKIPAVSLIVFFAGLLAIMREKYAHLFGLSFLYVWLYGGWPLLPASAGCAWIMRELTNYYHASDYEELRIKNNELKITFLCKLQATSHKLLRNLCAWPSLKLPLASLSGALCGLIINPYFPTNLSFYWIQTLKIAMLNVLSEVSVGGEWYPAGLSFIPAHGPTLILLAFALCAYAFPGLFASVFHTRTPERSWQRTFLCVLTLLFFALTLKSRRYGEYFAPLATFFSCMILAPLLSRADIKRLVHTTQRALKHPFSLAGSIAIYFFIAFPAIIIINTFDITRSVRSGYGFLRYTNGLAWIKEHVPGDTIIFHNRWDDFPVLYYHASNYRYISGLDPRFLYEQDMERAERYTAFWTGKDLSENFGYRAICTTIQMSLNKFDIGPMAAGCSSVEEKNAARNLVASFSPAAVIITDLDLGLDGKLMQKIPGGPGFMEKYRDEEMVILQSQE